MKRRILPHRCNKCHRIIWPWQPIHIRSYWAMSYGDGNYTLYTCDVCLMESLL